MSDNIVEITETSQYTITIDTSLVQNENGVTVETSAPNTVEIIDNNIVLLSDLPYGYPLDWTTGDLPIARVSGLDIVGGSGISVSDNSGVYTIAVTGTFGLTGEEVDDRVGDLLTAGSYISLNYNDSLDSLNISVTGLQPSGNYSVVGHSHTISDVSSLQNVLDSKQPSGIYASGIHNHTSSDITNFSSSVSGLLPVKNITSGSGISVSNNSGVFSVAVTGTFGLTSEQVDDRVNDLLKAGSYVNINYNDSLDSLTISVTGLQPSGNYSVEGHSHVIADISGLQNALDNKQPSGSYAPLVHSHSSSDIIDFNNAVSGLIPPSNFTSLTGVSGVVVTNSGTDYTVSLTDSTIQLTDITDLSSDARSFLLTPSSLNLQTLIANETGSGLLVFNDSPAFSGIPTVPTAPSGTNNSQIANTSFVRSEISNLVNSAPSTLDTLNELATALGNDPNFATTIASGLGQKSNIGHTHSTTDISNFNSGVSGLLPTVSGSGYVKTSLSNNIYNISVSGLQPSGNYANSIHTHVSSDITDFNSSVSGLIPVKNIVSGTGVNISSVSGEYTVSVTGVAASSASSLITSCHNLTGSTISKMSAVYINGGHGNEPTITLALASGEATSSKTFGLTMEDISDNHSGDVVVVGSLIDVNTSQFGVVEGTTLYLSPTIPGAITTTKPSAPYHLVSLGKIVRNHTSQGIIQVSIQNGFELEELHNVAISGVSNGQFLQYNGPSGLWVPTSSGNFSTLLINGTGVSVNGHSHASSDITNFNNSVSGLLPSVSGSEYVTSTFSNNTYSISITGLQPSGNYSLVGHTHTSSNITDFNTAAGAAAPVQSVAGRTGTISLTKNDVGLGNVDNTSDSSKPVSTAQALADSAVQSYSIQRGNHTGSQLSSTISDFNSSVSGLLPVTNILGGSNITVSQSGTIYTVAVTGSLGLTTEEVDDRVSNLLVAGTGIGLSYDDNANSLTIAVSGLSSTAKVGNGISGVITYNLSDPLNVVGSGSTTIDYNNISKTVTIGSPSLIREYELINSTKSSFTVTGGYALNNLDVYHNGIKLLASGDYSATNGTSFTLVQPAVSGDVVEWLGYSVVPRSQLILGEVRSDTVGNINYLGRAVAGSSESSSVWTIKRYTVADNGIDITTATASNASWTNRLSVSYI